MTNQTDQTDTSKTEPVVVVLNCEATRAVNTVEYDRDEWEAMTPSERAVMLDNAVQTHIANQGGGGWYIADPDDEASVGMSPLSVQIDADAVMQLVTAYGAVCREDGALSDRATELAEAIRRKLTGQDA